VGRSGTWKSCEQQEVIIMLETLPPDENGTVQTEQGFRRLFTRIRRHLGKPRSLRRKLARWNALVLLLTLALLEVIVYLAVISSLTNDVDQQLKAQAIRLEVSTRSQTVSGQPSQIAFFQQLVSGVLVNEFTATPLYIKVFDAHTGHLLAVSPYLNQVLLPLSRSDFEAALHGQQILGEFQDVHGNQVHALTLPLYDKTQRLVAVAQVIQSLQVVQQVRAILLIVLGVGGPLAALAAYGLSFWLTSRELRPLSRLITTMHTLSEQHLEIRFHPQRLTTEIVLLARAFNQMLDRLEASFALQHSFVADISHELRTPLTSIQGQLDVLLLDPELKDEMRTDLHQVSAEVRRLSRLIANLLTTVRAEAGISPQPFSYGIQFVELDLLVIEVARQAHFLNQQITLKIGQLEQISVPGDADLLKQLLLNLVDNALSYTPPTGQITLELTRSDTATPPVRQDTQHGQKEWAVLHVCDTGPGIDPEDLPHIFERYYRARHTGPGSKLGAGLGLSIARLIAVAHGGQITVESELGKGTCFHLWLPTTSHEPRG
jgi:two-component system, OmpR family, sensor kinase